MRELETASGVRGRLLVSLVIYFSAAFVVARHAPIISGPAALLVLLVVLAGMVVVLTSVVAHTAQFVEVEPSKGGGPSGREIGLSRDGAVCPECRSQVTFFGLFTTKNPQGLGILCKKCGVPLQFCANRNHVMIAGLIIWISLAFGFAKFVAPAFYPWARKVLLLAVAAAQPLIMWKLLVVFSTVDMREGTESENETLAP